VAVIALVILAWEAKSAASPPVPYLIAADPSATSRLKLFVSLTWGRGCVSEKYTFHSYHHRLRGALGAFDIAIGEIPR